MSDDKKYYYLKLKDDFYYDERIRIMESAENGIYYTNLLLKLYLKSLKTNGELRFTKTIPYNEQMIATITNMNIDIVRSGLKVLMELQFIERMDDGTLYMTEIQNYIGKSSTTADRVREFRKKIDDKKMLTANKKQKYEETYTNVADTEEQMYKPPGINVTDVEAQMYEEDFTNVTEDEIQMYEEPETNVTADEKQMYKDSETNVTQYEDQMFEKPCTNVTKSRYICTPEIEIEKEIKIYIQQQHKITENDINVNTQNKKDFKNVDDVVDVLKNIAIEFLRLTNRKPNLKDIECINRALDSPMLNFSDYRSKEMFIIQAMRRINRSFEVNNPPGSSINSFKYFSIAIFEGLRSNSSTQNGGKEHEHERSNNDILVTKSGRRYDLSNFAANRGKM